jgi:hypothetical protein
MTKAEMIRDFLALNRVYGARLLCGNVPISDGSLLESPMFLHAVEPAIEPFFARGANALGISAVGIMCVRGPANREWDFDQVASFPNADETRSYLFIDANLNDGTHNGYSFKTYRGWRDVLPVPPPSKWTVFARPSVLPIAQVLKLRRGGAAA